MENNKFQKENIIKIFFLGGINVGKTNMINVYTNRGYCEYEPTTISPNFVEALYSSENKIFKIKLWDTNSRENLRSLTSIFYRNSDIVIFVYSDKKSFEELKDYWVKSVIDNIGNNIVFGLAANKSDLFLEEVSAEEGFEYAKEIGAIFRVTSSKYDEEGIKLFINELIDEHLYKNKLISRKQINKFYNLLKYFNQ